jgi:hypothetical protein
MGGRFSLTKVTPSTFTFIHFQHHLHLHFRSLSAWGVRLRIDPYWEHTPPLPSSRSIFHLGKVANTIQVLRPTWYYQCVLVFSMVY